MVPLLQYSLDEAREKGCCNKVNRTYFVPKQAWIPAFAGMTAETKKFITDEYLVAFFTGECLGVDTVLSTSLN